MSVCVYVMSVCVHTQVNYFRNSSPPKMGYSTHRASYSIHLLPVHCTLRLLPVHCTCHVRVIAVRPRADRPSWPCTVGLCSSAPPAYLPLPAAIWHTTGVSWREGIKPGNETLDLAVGLQTVYLALTTSTKSAPSLAENSEGREGEEEEDSRRQSMEPCFR